MLSHFHLIPERYGQTDGQTDRQTDGRTDGRTDLLYQYRASVCWRAIKTIRWQVKSLRYNRSANTIRYDIILCASRAVKKLTVTVYYTESKENLNEKLNGEHDRSGPVQWSVKADHGYATKSLLRCKGFGDRQADRTVITDATFRWVTTLNFSVLLLLLLLQLLAKTVMTRNEVMSNWIILDGSISNSSYNAIGPHEETTYRWVTSILIAFAPFITQVSTVSYIGL